MIIQDTFPNLENFDPTIIPYQYRVIKDIRRNYDYSLGKHEILLSGSVGSAKSILMAHLVVTHCLENKGALVCLGRRAMPDLKATILKEVLDHLEEVMVEGIHYEYNKSRPSIKFLHNKSEIMCASWADQNYRKARSYKLSMLAIEEVVENDNEEFDGFYKEWAARLGRRPWIKENIIIGATNPDAPSHNAYDYFIIGEKKHKTRHVYYSKTSDNPFLPDTYIDQLRDMYTEKECRRMIDGEWLEIRSEIIYYAFDEELNVIEDYKFNPELELCISFDFNIGFGKPLSASIFQEIDGKYTFFDEIVIHGCRTDEAVNEFLSKPYINTARKIVVYGDAAGRHRDTRNKKSDYDLINNGLLGSGVSFKIDVPLSNPAIRTRHIDVNGKLCNANGERNLLVTKNCKTLIKGLRLTKLKKGSTYTEDDSASQDYQHISTTVGYGIVRREKRKKIGKSSSRIG